MHKGKNLYSEQEAVIMGFIKELKEEFEIIKERDPGIKISNGGFALSVISCYA